MKIKPESDLVLGDHDDHKPEPQYADSEIVCDIIPKQTNQYMLRKPCGHQYKPGHIVTCQLKQYEKCCEEYESYIKNMEKWREKNGEIPW